jgi:hypothetical protein
MIVMKSLQPVSSELRAKKYIRVVLEGGIYTFLYICKCSIFFLFSSSSSLPLYTGGLFHVNTIPTQQIGVMFKQNTHF